MLEWSSFDQIAGMQRLLQYTLFMVHCSCSSGLSSYQLYDCDHGQCNEELWTGQSPQMASLKTP